MSRYSADFVTTVATIAIKAAAYTQGAWTHEECVAFAWFSVGQTGDASIDDIDFNRHMGRYMNEEG